MQSNENMVQLTLWSEEALANHSQSLDSVKGLTIQEAISCWNISESLQPYVRDGSSGKMSQVFFPQKKDQTLAPSFKRWLNSGIVCAGECWMLNTSEFPNVVEESFLSDVLIKQIVHSKYYLSVQAAKGILMRAEKRDKVISPKLKEVLENMVQIEEENQTKK